MSREAIDALEQWHATTRSLREAKPGSSDWVRLRMIAREQRAAYEELVEGDEAAHRLQEERRDERERSAAR